MLILPYKKEQGERALRNINRNVNRHLPEVKKAQVIQAVTKLGSKFNIKDVTKKEHQHGSIYSVKFPLETCEECLIGEIGRKIAERVSEHSGRYKSFDRYKSSIEKDHPAVKILDFEIFSKRFSQKNSKEKIFLKKISPL